MTYGLTGVSKVTVKVKNKVKVGVIDHLELTKIHLKLVIDVNVTKLSSVMSVFATCLDLIGFTKPAHKCGSQLR